MDAITVRCQNCDHSMKFSADKAGKRAKCPKCQALIQIPVPQEVPEPAPAAPPAEPDPFADDGPASYVVTTDHELEERRKAMQAEEEAAGKKKKDRKKLPSVGRKIKAIPDAESWAMVRTGMLFVFFGTWIWLACHLLQGSYVLLGKVEFPGFAGMMANNLDQRREPAMPGVGEAWNMDWLGIYLGMIAGENFLGYARIALVLATVLYVIHAILWGIGYGFCFPVPRRYGMFGHVLLLLGLAAFNLLVMLIFKVLPVLGVHNYVMIPLVTPEIVLTEYNMERMVPINILWSGAPFWENTGCLIFKFLFYLEPTLLSIFVWSAGIAIKDEKIEQLGQGRVQMSLGTFFMLVVFHLLSLSGSSPVLVNVLRVIYTAWYFFLVIYMLQYTMMLLKLRAVLYDKIHPKFELDEEEEEAPKKKKK